MRTTNLLLIVIVSILSISCANSKKVVYANEINKLNDNQQCILEHTKNTYHTGDNKILLPTELNVLLGDSATAQNIEAHPQWDNAYFVKDREDDVLIVPLKSNHNEVELFSDLIIMKKDSIYPKIVSTYLECKAEKTTEYIQIESFINGTFYRAMVCDKNNQVIAVYGPKDMSVGVGNNTESNWSKLSGRRIYSAFHTAKSHRNGIRKYNFDWREYQYDLENFPNRLRW